MSSGGPWGHHAGYSRAVRERFAEVRPAMTMVEEARRILPEHRVEIEVHAVLGDGAAI